MEKTAIISHFKTLSTSEQTSLMQALEELSLSEKYSEILTMRGDALDDKRSECPYCQECNYMKNGKEKSARKYRCKDCKRGFTEYTGTWISGLHNKKLIPAFLKTMVQELSLKKTGIALKIAEGTAFNWRHKFLSGVEIKDKSDFIGITEADETFYHHSQKGKKCTDREARRRGGRPSKGITNQEASVLTVMDREGNYELIFTNMGRISKQDITQAIGNRVTERTILCSDAHQSYKAFTNAYNIEHQVVNASKKERVKGQFHIQHINSLHGELKHFFNYDLRGVSTKYLQKYLNWQKLKEQFTNPAQWIKDVLTLSLKLAKALEIFTNIEKDYNKIYVS